MYRSMPCSSSTSRILSVCFIYVFLCWGRQLPACKESGTKTCNPHPDRFRPIFYRPCLAPGGGQLPDPIPCRPDFGCQEGGKSRRKLPNGTRQGFLGQYPTHSP